MRRNSGHTSCYMCSGATTSKEHAPPSCLFPEMDTFGRDLRKNLITVPSCDVHNSLKSKDDEFFRTILLFAAVEHSEGARHQFFEKLLPAAARSPWAYGSFLNDRGAVDGGGHRAIQIDRLRFERCANHMVRALYFHCFQEKWCFPVAIVSPNFFLQHKKWSGDSRFAHA